MLRLPWGSLAVELKRKKHQTHPDGTMTSQKLKPVDPIGALNDRFPLLSLGELQSEAARIEEAIQNTALASIMHLFSQNKSFRPSGQSEFIFNDKLYRINIGPLISTPSIHICILNSLDPTCARVSSGTRAIPGIGYFNELEVEVPTTLKNHLSKITEAIERVYLMSYAWLEEEFFRNIKELEEGFSEALYSHLRIALSASGKKELASKVWFSIFSQKNGYYAIDGSAIRQILNTLKSRKYSSEQSPLSHVVELLGLSMPYNKSLSQYAIAKSEYHEFSLKKAAYISDMQGIFKTEEQMVEGGAYAIFPLGSIGDRKLVAAFPSNLRDDLLPVFKENSKKFNAIYALETKSLKRHIIKIQSSFKKMDHAELGGLIGGIIAGIFKNI